MSKNELLTLDAVKKLKKDDSITVCCKNKNGIFNNYTDTVIISHLTRFKGIKGLVLIQYDGTWSYHCLDKKKFTMPDFTTGEELEVYFILNK